MLKWTLPVAPFCKRVTRICSTSSPTENAPEPTLPARDVKLPGHMWRPMTFSRTHQSSSAGYACSRLVVGQYNCGVK